MHLPFLGWFNKFSVLYSRRSHSSVFMWFPLISSASSLKPYSEIKHLFIWFVFYAALKNVFLIQGWPAEWWQETWESPGETHDHSQVSSRPYHFNRAGEEVDKSGRWISWLHFPSVTKALRGSRKLCRAQPLDRPGIYCPQTWLTVSWGLACHMKVYLAVSWIQLQPSKKTKHRNGMV